MASTGKKKMTMAKRERENKLRERRQDKQARKAARKHAAQFPEESAAHGNTGEGDETPAVEPIAEIDPGAPPSSP
ncbi:MAG TPA: hypothetical protein VHT27_13925 [Solirubrobacteraceae bacterium]|jgi:hypothetical protein|nr:hypothetical protein [Solirubrobacteraceae bacterium]